MRGQDTVCSTERRTSAILTADGGGNPKDAEKIKDIPCWCFPGDKDTAVKVKRSQEMMETLKKTVGKPKYTEYPGVGHDSWEKTYAEKELRTWLEEQKNDSSIRLHRLAHSVRHTRGCG